MVAMIQELARTSSRIESPDMEDMEDREDYIYRDALLGAVCETSIATRYNSALKGEELVQLFLRNTKGRRLMRLKCSVYRRVFQLSLIKNRDHVFDQLRIQFMCTG